MWLPYLDLISKQNIVVLSVSNYIWLLLRGTCETVVTVVRVADALLRFFALSFDMTLSAWSARSSDSSRSCCTLRYLARLIAANSSCRQKENIVGYIRLRRVHVYLLH